MTQPTHLFSPMVLRGVTLRNRIGVSPMCQYSSEDACAADWHLVHYGSRATGGAGLVITEATAVEARGRISPYDLGLWDDTHIEPLARITRFCREHGAATAVQLAHAGRKAATDRPWNGGKPLAEGAGGWPRVAPSALPFAEGHPVPDALDADGVVGVVAAFASAAGRAVAARFDMVEIHAAHGYLLHQFLSPLSNHRTDLYGGSYANRVRALCEVVQAVRVTVPEGMPVIVRLSVTDWVEGGWDIEQSVELSRTLKTLGVDLVDCSSGGAVAGAAIPVGPGYQAAFADRIRREAGIATAAVGLVTSPEQADQMIRTGQADVALLARELLRDPYWPARAASKLGHEIPAPPQYVRAW